MSVSVAWPRHPDELRSLETEGKYVAPAHQANVAARVLERICDSDPEFPSGVVSSIYYDTMNLDYLAQKRNSDYLKTKVRCRWYEQLGGTREISDRAFAELKYRVGSKRAKLRLPTRHSGSRLANTPLTDRELLDVPALLVAKGAPIHKTVFPLFVVRYCRRRYVEKVTGARVCLDYDITSPRSNSRMLGTTFPCSLEETVLEIKSADETFPAPLVALLKLGFRRASFSKYYECYAHLTRTLF